jgi:hypothetical protein
MAHNEIAVGDRTGEREERAAERLVAAIDERRCQPLDDDRVALHQELQRLGQVPPVDVEIVRKRQLDHVAPRPRRQIMGEWADVEEAAVVIAVGRGKAPGTTAALYRKPDRHAVLAHNIVDCRIDAGDLVCIHRRWNAAKAHCVLHVPLLVQLEDEANTAVDQARQGILDAGASCRHHLRWTTMDKWGSLGQD